MATSLRFRGSSINPLVSSKLVEVNSLWKEEKQLLDSNSASLCQTGDLNLWLNTVLVLKKNGKLLMIPFFNSEWEHMLTQEKAWFKHVTQIPGGITSLENNCFKRSFGLKFEAVHLSSFAISQ